MISYSGWKLFCTSTPRPLEGRSLICPIEAITMKSLPRYLLIVFALAGDSTMTKFFAITSQVRSGPDDCLMTGGGFQTNCRRFLGARIKITLSMPLTPNRRNLQDRMTGFNGTFCDLAFSQYSPYSALPNQSGVKRKLCESISTC